jgi:hypothetical protein
MFAVAGTTNEQAVSDSGSTAGRAPLEEAETVFERSDDRAKSLTDAFRCPV